MPRKLKSEPKRRRICKAVTTKQRHPFGYAHYVSAKRRRKGFRSRMSLSPKLRRTLWIADERIRRVRARVEDAYDDFEEASLVTMSGGVMTSKRL